MGCAMINAADIFGIVGQLNAICERQQHAPRIESSDRDRIVLMLRRKKVIAVSDVMRELGIPDMTARRVLAEIEPSVARAIPGRPARWRAV